MALSNWWSFISVTFITSPNSSSSGVLPSSGIYPSRPKTSPAKVSYSSSGSFTQSAGKPVPAAPLPVPSGPRIDAFNKGRCRSVSSSSGPPQVLQQVLHGYYFAHAAVFISTMAKWFRLCFMLRNNTSVRTVSGTKYAGLTAYSRMFSRVLSFKRKKSFVFSTYYVVGSLVAHRVNGIPAFSYGFLHCSGVVKP